MSIFQIVYCSRNRIMGSAAAIESEIGAILSAARAKNQQAGITGALLFNGSGFAQVLEGPLAAVEETFEIIQRDERHSDVVMLRIAEAEARVFSGWSMAYASPDAVLGGSQAEINLDEAFADPVASGPRIVTLLEQLILRGPSDPVPSPSQSAR